MIYEYGKHLRAIFPSLVWHFVTLVIGFVVWNFLFLTWVHPVQKEYSSLKQARYTDVVESSDSVESYLNLKKLNNIITFNNSEQERMNINTYIARGKGLLENLSLNEHEAAISVKMAEKLKLSMGDRVWAEYPIYDEPIEYVVTDILPYASDFYDVMNNQDFSYAVIGDDGTLFNQAQGKTVYFLGFKEYNEFMLNGYSYSNRFNINDECTSMRFHINLLYAIMLSLLIIFVAIMLYLANREICKEVLKYYYDGFDINVVKMMDRIDHLLICGLPIIFEIAWLLFEISSMGISIIFFVCTIIIFSIALIVTTFAGGWKFGKANRI